MNSLNRAVSSITHYYDLVGEDHMSEEIRCRTLPVEIQQSFEVLRSYMNRQAFRSPSNAPFLTVIFRINN